MRCPSSFEHSVGLTATRHFLSAAAEDRTSKAHSITDKEILQLHNARGLADLVSANITIPLLTTVSSLLEVRRVRKKTKKVKPLQPPNLPRNARKEGKARKDNRQTLRRRTRSLVSSLLTMFVDLAKNISFEGA